MLARRKATQPELKAALTHASDDAARYYIDLAKRREFAANAIERLPDRRQLGAKVPHSGAVRVSQYRSSSRNNGYFKRLARRRRQHLNVVTSHYFAAISIRWAMPAVSQAPANFPLFPALPRRKCPSGAPVPER